MAKQSSLLDAEQLVVLPQFRKDSHEPQRVITSLQADHALGSFRAESVLSRFFFLTQVSADFNTDILVQPKDQTRPFVGIALMETGINTAHFGHHEHKIQGQAGECASVINPGLPEAHSFLANQPTTINYFEIDTTYFTSQVTQAGNDHNITNLHYITERILKGEFIEPGKREILPAHRRIVFDIFNCPLEGGLGEMMLEGSLHQLIALQLTLCKHHTAVPRKSMNSRNRDVMHAIKVFLESTFMQDHSLAGISRHFGINQSKLKKGFKEVFHVSVIEFLYDLRMEQARLMLCENNMSVGDVAALVGYKNPNHFATAFKRKFSVNPSKLR
jgi:AraC-like DNA-binding protein